MHLIFVAFLCLITAAYVMKLLLIFSIVDYNRFVFICLFVRSGVFSRIFSVMEFMSLVRLQIVTNLLGLSASFYLGFNLILRGGLAEIPIIFLSLVALIFFRSDEASKHDNFKAGILWGASVLALALWNCFMIWFHEGEVELYEPYAKLLVGSLAVFALAYHRVNMIYVRAGIYLAAILLVYQYIFQYDGRGRFTGGMNANKWAPMLLSYAMITLFMVVCEKTKLLKFFAFLSWLVFAAMIFIAVSRGSALILIIVSMCISAYFMIVRNRLLIFLLIFSGVLLAGYLFVNLTDSHIERRGISAIKELKSANSDNFNSSVGIRYMMWKSGLYSVHENLLFGSGYDLKKSIENYEPESIGEEKTVAILKKRFGSFHNIWVDTLVSQGVIGLCVLMSFFMVSLRLVIKNGTLLLFGPLIAVGLNGLTESTLYMSILAGHLVLAGSIFVNIKGKKV